MNDCYSECSPSLSLSLTHTHTHARTLHDSFTMDGCGEPCTHMFMYVFGRLTIFLLMVMDGCRFLALACLDHFLGSINNIEYMRGSGRLSTEHYVYTFKFGVGTLEGWVSTGWSHWNFYQFCFALNQCNSILAFINSPNHKTCYIKNHLIRMKCNQLIMRPLN